MNEKVKIKAIHSHYQRSKIKGDKDDAVFLNQMVFNPDGTTEKRFKILVNPKRNWFYVKKPNQGHTQRKLCFPRSELDEFECTQATLAEDINWRVNRSRYYKKLRELNDDVNLFGTDIHVESIVRQKYIERFGDVPYLPTTGTMDYEWDVDTGLLYWGVFAFKREVYLTVRSDKVRNNPDYVNEIKAGYIKYNQPELDKIIKRLNLKACKGKLTDVGDLDLLSLIDKMKEYNKSADKPLKITPQAVFDVHVIVVDRPVDVAWELFKHVHRLQPDFLAFWLGGALIGSKDSSYEIGSDWVRIKQACEYDGVPIEELFCDPRVPEKFKNVYIHHDTFIPESVSGTGKAPPETAKFHRVEAPATFIMCDLNFFFYINRAHLPDRASYGLDAICRTEIGSGKLDFKDKLKVYENLIGKEYHQRMSSEQPVPYGLYCIQDGIAPLLLEEINQEISARSYPRLGVARWNNFKSNPKRLATQDHFAYLEQGLVIGATGTNVRSPVHDRLISSAGIIITLPSDSILEMGTCGILDTDDEMINFVQANTDSDLTSSYPKNQIASNASLPTTRIEILEVEGYTREDFMSISLGFCAGNNSNLQFAKATCAFPSLDTWNDLFEQDLASGVFN